MARRARQSSLSFIVVTATTAAPTTLNNNGALRPLHPLRQLADADGSRPTTRQLETASCVTATKDVNTSNNVCFMVAGHEQLLPLRLAYVEVPPNWTGVHTMETNATAVHREPWNKGKIVGQKAPFKLKDIWALRVRLQMANRVRELALFDLGIDSKLRGCDLVKLKVRDVCHGDQVASRTVVMQQKTQRPVQFEITPATRDAIQKWIKQAGLKSEDFLFPSRIHESPHLGTRQYARILEGWVEELGLDPAAYGTHSIRRTKATLIYRRTKNIRAVQLLLGHTKAESLLPGGRGAQRLTNEVASPRVR
jgi:Phage integrase family